MRVDRRKVKRSPRNYCPEAGNLASQTLASGPKLLFGVWAGTDYGNALVANFESDQ